jgi:ubiquinone/menaquinone biosynthesis C-methylase UbiE
MTDAASSVQKAYDAVAREYDRQISHELDHKPLDRAWLTAFADLVGTGTIADVGCGPGHVTRYLAELHHDVVGVDLSPAMIAIARERAPKLTFTVESMLALAAGDEAWVGVVAWYSIIHLEAHQRPAAYAEFARVLQPGGHLLIAFHIDSPQFATGHVNHIYEWFGQHVQLDGYFLDPEQVAGQVSAAGFTLIAKMERLPGPDVEYPSRRSYLLFQRN